MRERERERERETGVGSREGDGPGERSIYRCSPLFTESSWAVPVTIFSSGNAFSTSSRPNFRGISQPIHPGGIEEVAPRSKSKIMLLHSKSDDQLGTVARLIHTIILFHLLIFFIFSRKL